MIVTIHQVNDAGPVKEQLKEYMLADYQDIKMIRWEAMELVRKANEYALKEEIMTQKTFDKLPIERQWAVKEKFYKDWLATMDDDKADRLVKILAVMIEKHMN